MQHVVAIRIFSVFDLIETFPLHFCRMCIREWLFKRALFETVDRILKERSRDIRHVDIHKPLSRTRLLPGLNAIVHLRFRVLISFPERRVLYGIRS